MSADFVTVQLSHRWRPIRGCPGRWVMWASPRELDLQELVGCPVEVTRFDVETTRDPILVAPLTGGGLISYLQPDGRFIHTLCNTSGFLRKLSALGIPTATF